MAADSLLNARTGVIAVFSVIAVVLFFALDVYTGLGLVERVVVLLVVGIVFPQVINRFVVARQRASPR